MIMNKCSFFIKDKGLFGSYPTQEDVLELERNGVVLFVNLTSKRENLPEYVPNVKYISFPITDYGIPSDIPDFCRLILLLESKIRNLKSGEKIYIHCKGGHGRVGVVVASLLARINKIGAEEAIKLATYYHKQRKNLTSVRRNSMCPEKQRQRDFVIHLFEPIFFYKPSRTGADVGFSNFSPHIIQLPELGTFFNAESAFQAYKCPDDEKYVKELQREENPYVAKKMGAGCNLRKDWIKVRDELMYKVLRAKFTQNQDIKVVLLCSGFRPLVHHTEKDKYFGDGGDWGNGSIGRNMLGKILERVRERLIIDLYK